MGENRLSVVEDHLVLARGDLNRANSRIDHVVARAAEDGDAAINDRLSYFYYTFRQKF